LLLIFQQLLDPQLLCSCILQAALQLPLIHQPGGTHAAVQGLGRC
jgi:hypothetical protein